MHEAPNTPDVTGRDIDPRDEKDWSTSIPGEEFIAAEPDTVVVKLIAGQFKAEELQYYRNAGYLVVYEGWGYSIYNE